MLHNYLLLIFTALLCREEVILPPLYGWSVTRQNGDEVKSNHYFWLSKSELPTTKFQNLEESYVLKAQLPVTSA